MNFFSSELSSCSLIYPKVIDDGVGMSSKSLEVVGDRHWTSKMIATKDEKERKMFGYAGESLANIR